MLAAGIECAYVFHFLIKYPQDSGEVIEEIQFPSFNRVMVWRNACCRRGMSICISISVIKEDCHADTTRQSFPGSLAFSEKSRLLGNSVAAGMVRRYFSFNEKTLTC